MALPIKKLTVRFTFQSARGGAAEVVELNNLSDLDISVKTSKHALSIQNSCNIAISGLRVDIRQRLMTAFTAWNYTKQTVTLFVQVEVFAGYSERGLVNPMSRIFVGDVVKCNITGVAPDCRLTAEAFTRQVDRTNLTPVSIPVNATFKTVLELIAKAAGLIPDCNTTRDEQRTISNFGAFMVNPTGEPKRLSVQGAIGGLLQLFGDKIAVWVDDDRLMARDIGRRAGTDVARVSVFIDSPPSWNEWGITFKTLFNPELRIAAACAINSKVNTGANGEFIITSLEYELAPRQGPFYVTVKASPPARSRSN